ncbi:hypothetical protein [Haloplanus sp.]|uniref:hypothetical protein n=1 Tax=Haloplanus sp. TaxID=1961696 RepID=UPI00263836B7|nr:hypothetical protein [Haloplanus sp.]
MEPSDAESIDTASATVTVGDGLYDTEHDRVLWVSRIDGSGVTIEPATEYETETQVGWPPGGRSRIITAGTTLAPAEFIELIDTGRFEVAPR